MCGRWLEPSDATDEGGRGGHIRTIGLEAHDREDLRTRSMAVVEDVVREEFIG